MVVPKSLAKSMDSVEAHWEMVVYISGIGNICLNYTISPQIGKSTTLRLPIFVEITFLKSQPIPEPILLLNDSGRK